MHFEVTQRGGSELSTSRYSLQILLRFMSRLFWYTPRGAGGTAALAGGARGAKVPFRFIIANLNNCTS